MKYLSQLINDITIKNYTIRSLMAPRFYIFIKNYTPVYGIMI